MTAMVKGWTDKYYLLKGDKYAGLFTMGDDSLRDIIRRILLFRKEGKRQS
jgi:hypothetical protein